MTQAAKAERLRQLHHGGDVLLLANCWDVASARMLEEMGFPALATSSAAIANSLGYADGERIPRAEMLAVMARIAAAVQVPVSADCEGGYSANAAGVAETARQVIAAGAVGINLEDSQDDESRLRPLEEMVERIRAARATAAAAGVPLVINARCDAFFLHGTPPFEPLAEAVRRGQAYRAAGADCVFLPGLRDLAMIRNFLAASPGPINILGGTAAPAVGELAKAGVRRISLGSGPYRAALAHVRKVAEEVRSSGSFAALAGAVPPPEANGWFSK
jgi:2-methylisocitrate lyase-like PEP mutase family enzyme